MALGHGDFNPAASVGNPIPKRTQNIAKQHTLDHLEHLVCVCNAWTSPPFLSSSSTVLQAASVDPSLHSHSDEDPGTDTSKHNHRVSVSNVSNRNDVIMTLNKWPRSEAAHWSKKVNVNVMNVKQCKLHELWHWHCMTLLFLFHLFSGLPCLVALCNLSIKLCHLG